MKRSSAIALALLLSACGGVSHRLAANVAQPRSIAVLPLDGPASPSLREATRQLIHSRIESRGYQAPELAWVDRVLAERGWLGDPATFRTASLPLDEVCKALAVDAVLVGTDLDESSFNVFVLRRHAVSGTMAVRFADSRDWWSSSHTASTFGGFLLTSGQVFAELRAQGEHGSPMATLALADELVLDVSSTVPLATQQRPAGESPMVRSIKALRTPLANGQHRIVVEAEASELASLRFDLDPHTDGVPMVAQPLTPGRYVGALDLPADTKLKRVAVRARDAYGRESATEIPQ